jgi:predicted nucleotidyltransferase component of viral defense system
VAASVRARLLKLAKANGEEFTYSLTRYGLERLLARLSISPHADAFILKGAMLFRVWSPTLHRPTKDLDLLSRGPPELKRLAEIFADVCGVVVDDDGLVFDAKTVQAQRIKEDADYEGVRVALRAHLGTARIDLQVDIGFGDAITPAAIEIDFPTMLAMPAPRIRAYPKETVVAEKLHAMVELGLANSRMKDFFDLWFLAQTFSFEGRTLATAIGATFARRKTPFPGMTTPLALSSAFHENETKRIQWKAFCQRARVTDATLEAIVTSIAGFAGPALAAASEPAQFRVAWSPAGPWTPLEQ